jgi:hypothetical protein
MEKKIFTDSGIEINPLNKPDDEFVNREIPVQYTFTRGIISDMFR